MNVLKKAILPVLSATIWISLSEFFRNELLVKSDWVNHYEALGLVFPSDPINGAIWGLWSFLFAIAIYILTKKFTLIQTTFLAWLTGFVLMWIVIGNMGVLPKGLLLIAIPLSLLEVYIAALIINKLSVKNNE